MPTSEQNKKFKDSIIAEYLLDEAITWIHFNLDPEDVFSKDDLDQWAKENGYVKADDK